MPNFEHMHAAAERENEKLYARIERLEKALGNLVYACTAGEFRTDGKHLGVRMPEKAVVETARAELAKDIDDE